MQTTGLESAQLRLNTLKNTRRTFARIIRLYARGEIQRDLYRDLCYGLGGLLSYWKTELDAEVIDRLEALESAIFDSDIAREQTT